MDKPIESKINALQDANDAIRSPYGPPQQVPEDPYWLYVAKSKKAGKYFIGVTQCFIGSHLFDHYSGLWGSRHELSDWTRIYRVNEFRVVIIDNRKQLNGWILRYIARHGLENVGCADPNITLSREELDFVTETPRPLPLSVMNIVIDCLYGMKCPSQDEL
jgi:hypothetical protein